MIQRTTLPFGKVNLRKLWGNPSARKDCPCNITISLTMKDNIMIFNAHAVITSPTGQVLLYGQCFDELANIKELADNDLFIKIYELWQKYSNKIIHAGNPKQDTAIKYAIANDIIPSFDFDTCRNYLKSIGLYTINLPDNSLYYYGKGWLNEPIPEEDKQVLANILATKSS